MRVLEFSVFIAASPAAVFRVIADPRSKLAWVPAIRRVELESDASLGLGTKYLTSSGLGPLELAFDEQIVEWVENERVAYEGHSVWGYFRAAVVLKPQDASTHLHYRMDYSFPGGCLGASIGRTMTLLYRRRVGEKTAMRLKSVIEEALWQPGIM
jgi:uncharacterized protein YndB with AHSA1/START domain